MSIQIDRSKLRNVNKVKVTRGLFLETSQTPEYILYTLKQEDYQGYPSLYRLYLEECSLDPTELTFARKYFWDYEHWVEISLSTYLKDYLTVWRRELAAILESRYLAKLHDLVEKGGKESFPALRYLLDRLQMTAGGVSRGRPRKIATQHEIERTASLGRMEAIQVEKDFLRLSSKPPITN